MKYRVIQKSQNKFYPEVLIEDITDKTYKCEWNNILSNLGYAFNYTTNLESAKEYIKEHKEDEVIIIHEIN